MHHETTTEQAPRLDWLELINTAMEAPGSVGNVYNRFYEYSFLNQMLMRMQGLSEPVATYARWQSVGRQVLRGSKAALIVRPVIAKRSAEATGDEETGPRLVGFKPVRCIFGVSQTDG